MLGSSGNWRSIVGRRDCFTDRFVCALDLRNHGNSEFADSMTYDEMAGDVLNHMNLEGIEQAVIIGHSMGGKVAMTLALQCPERIAGLGVVDTAPVFYDHSTMHAKVLSSMRDLKLDMLESLAHARQQLAFGIPDLGTREFILTNLARESSDKLVGNRHWRWKVNLDALWNELMYGQLSLFPAQDLPPYPGPSFFLYGGRSAYVKRDYHAAIRRLFPSSQLLEVPDAGHWLHHERPADFLEHYNRWLEDVP